MNESYRAVGGGATGAIIIPAHNEERVIARVLDGLLPLLSAPEVDVIVVCNGCTDGTADVVRRYAGVTLLETPVGSKPAAMNLGDAATERWPRLYLDADIEIEAPAVEAVFRELSRPDAPLASRPSSVVETRGAMFPVRSYYRARARIPEQATRLWGAGLYAASERGHARFAAFPEVTADDSWFDGLFADGEKTIVETVPARVHAPRTTAALLRILARHRRGYVELATTDPGSRARGRALLGTIRGLPSALDACCYVALAMVARFRSRSTVGVGTQQWETDASTRASAAPGRVQATAPTAEGSGASVCVVGAGPVGLSFALEAADAGLRVLLLDAGGEDAGRRDKPVVRRRNDTIVDPDRHAPELQTTRVGVGGASWVWGGRCVTYEPVDFEQRDFVPASDWPIGFSAVKPWRAKAQEYLDCGAGGFASEEPGWEGLGDLEMSQLERWTRQPRLGPRLAARVAAHPLIDLRCDAPVVGVTFDAGGATVEGVRILSGGRPAVVRADRYVLAAGGLETTRLLLDAQRALPAAFGGIDGPLGRYYMGHTTGSIANVVLTNPADIADMDFQLDEHDSYVRRRFSLPAESLREHKLLNGCFYLDNPPFYDYRHRNATLSAVFLALSVGPVGRRILAEGIRLRHIGPAPRRYVPHIVNVLRRPIRAIIDCADIVRRRYLSNVRKPGFLLRNPGGTYAIHYHSEQVANPDSRMRLDGGRNADGTPSLEIDFRYTERDIDSVLRFHALLDDRLRAAGRGRVEYLDPAGNRAAAVWEQAIDGFHQIGTTRMSAVPTDGVVDGDCRVHGVDNLFIASSSVLRTSAEANPTFTAVCLALRLANHLAETPTAGVGAASGQEPARLVTEDQRTPV